MANLEVLKNVVLPLQGWFGREITDGKAVVYEEVLGEFSGQILSEAMRRLKREWVQQSIPQPATIRQMCEEVRTSVAIQSGARSEDFRHPWEERQSRIDRMVAEAMRRIPSMPLFDQARAEGWDKHFRDFAETAAVFQAHIVLKSPGFPYAGAMYDWLSRDAVKPYIRSEIERVRRLGYIDIQVPADAIPSWKARRHWTDGVQVRKYSFNG